uniref:Uncharacterized protein n=1 Tax=Arundo donax TaxID=35708 RepID=A0A0A9ETN6_ARUDO
MHRQEYTHRSPLTTSNLPGPMPISTGHRSGEPKSRTSVNFFYGC